MSIYRKPVYTTLTIANGAQKTEAFNLRDYVLAGIIFTGAFTGTLMTLEVSDAIGGTYLPLYDSDGNQITLQIAPSRGVGITAAEADALAPFEFVKLYASSVQAAERTLILVKK